MCASDNTVDAAVARRGRLKDEEAAATVARKACSKVPLGSRCTEKTRSGARPNGRAEVNDTLFRGSTATIATAAEEVGVAVARCCVLSMIVGAAVTKVSGACYSRTSYATDAPAPPSRRSGLALRLQIINAT